MTNQEFNKSEIEWAQNILKQPDYQIYNGKTMHQAAYEVLNRAIDRMLDENQVTAYGEWV